MTIQEAKDSLVVYLRDISDFNSALEDLRERFYKKKITLQPLIIAVGKTITELEDFYVYIDNTKFKFSSFISSLDTCFKTFHVFNLEYSEYCQGIWIFLQRYFFSFSTESEKPFAQVSGLISYLESIE